MPLDGAALPVARRGHVIGGQVAQLADDAASFIDFAFSARWTSAHAIGRWAAFSTLSFRFS